jgi:hypothetical protein
MIIGKIRIELECEGREAFIEELYNTIKEALTRSPQVLTLENVEALSELLTELVSRKKEEQESGK